MPASRDFVSVDFLFAELPALIAAKCRVSSLVHVVNVLKEARWNMSQKQNRWNARIVVGLLLLIGIVKKNAILLIDFAVDAERNQGASPELAIVRACSLRFRPILMTTFAALFGALPLAFGSGLGSELRRPLGITIVGGLLASQLLTLFTTPVVYLALESLRERAARFFSHGRGVEPSPGIGSAG